ncbi:MAG: hypothetical protein KKA67_06055 [Spirochaetes bacterium]|nr:hypothetical protein [Spirochaetota bacterium]MBU1079642.1 hypothetical protein [Spirochaetota bacterium]
MAGFDERDTVFSRMELREGTPRYEAYYAAHPSRKAADDAARAAKGPYAGDEPRRRIVDATFGLLEQMRPLARGEPSGERMDISPDTARTELEALAKGYGAVMFGTAVLGEACFYGIRGRGEEYGREATVIGRTGVVFAVRMAPAEIAAAPEPRAAAEVVNGYARVALVGLVLARCIRGWGWNASCTMDGRADVVLPVAARYAGLGSIGRSGILLTEEFGPCLRLGAVVTDLPLARTPRSAGTEARLCSTCSLCAKACPAGAIDGGTASSGRFKPVNDDACFAKWKEFGTDCGLCIASCPLSRVGRVSGSGVVGP